MDVGRVEFLVTDRVGDLAWVACRRRRGTRLRAARWSPHRPSHRASRQRQLPPDGEASRPVPAEQPCPACLQVRRLVRHIGDLKERSEQGMPCAATLLVGSHSDGRQMPVGPRPPVATASGQAPLRSE